MIALAGGGSTDPGNALNPCGLVVDWLRSCYRVAMVVRPGDPAILVDWYKADPGAKCLPGWSSFRSHNWECAREELASQVGQAGDLGEQPGPRTWRRQDKPGNGHTGDQQSLDCAIRHSDWWSDGLGPGDDSGPFDANLVPLCCKQPMCDSIVELRSDTLDVSAVNPTGFCTCLPTSLGTITKVEGEPHWYFGTFSGWRGSFSLPGCDCNLDLIVATDGAFTWPPSGWTLFGQCDGAGVGDPYFTKSPTDFITCDDETQTACFLFESVDLSGVICSGSIDFVFCGSFSGG